MYTGKIVFSQLMNHLPIHTFRRCVRRYRGEHWIKSFSCLDQYRCMAFARITYRESLRDIEACLRTQNAKLYHMGIRGNVSRGALADANELRDWRIYGDFALPALTIARLYKCRRQVELFFKWIKRHLRIKRFFGTSENAVKTQVRIAVSVYVLVAIIKKRLNIDASLYTILQVLSVTVFEKMQLIQMLSENENIRYGPTDSNQLNLFD